MTVISPSAPPTRKITTLVRGMSIHINNCRFCCTRSRINNRMKDAPGLADARQEFIMKDLYSFDCDEKA